MAMTTGWMLSLCGLAFGLAWVATALVRRWAMRAVLDVPNERSLHVTPTPRGGGLAIAIVVLCFEAWLLLTGRVQVPWGWAAWCTCALLACLGLQDDLRPMSARHRFVAQLVICGGWLWILLAPASLAAWGGWVLQWLVMVWLINLYNFMDGSDGLAGAQGLLTGLGGGLLALFVGETDIAVMALLTACASLGFLFWNWQPARIFLGDVGSYFLGGQFGVLLTATRAEGHNAFFWGILLGPFIVDATLTLLRRIFRGERWYAAHRSHAYQRLVQAGLGHDRVALAFALLGLCCSVPLAIAATRWPSLAWPCLLLAWSLPAGLWWRVIRGTEPVPG